VAHHENPKLPLVCRDFRILRTTEDAFPEAIAPCIFELSRDVGWDLDSRSLGAPMKVGKLVLEGVVRKRRVNVRIEHVLELGIDVQSRVTLGRAFGVPVAAAAATSRNPRPTRSGLCTPGISRARQPS
jgi:hypothetical protein